MLPEYEGLYLIEFVGSQDRRTVRLFNALYDMRGKPMYLLGENDIRYNFSTIISTQRIGD